MLNGKRTTEELQQAGLAALYASLGVADAIRFLRLYKPGSGDFTVERAAAIDRGEYDDLVREIEREAMENEKASTGRELASASTK